MQGWEELALAKKGGLVGHQGCRLHAPIALLLQALELVTNVHNLSQPGGTHVSAIRHTGHKAPPLPLTRPPVQWWHLDGNGGKALAQLL